MRSGKPADRLPVRVVVLMALATSAVTGVLTGCTTVSSGTPTAAGHRTTGPAAPTNGAAGITLPPRPADVSLTGVDPCQLLTTAQQRSLHLVAGREGLPDQLANNSPSCDYRPDDPTSAGEYAVVVDATEGIRLFGDQNLANNVRQVTVGGFPALDVTLKPPDLLQGCTTAVSVADSQMFLVNLGQPDQGTTTTQSCADTERVAAAVLATARTLK